MKSSSFLFILAVGCFFIVDHSLDQFIYLFIESIINQYKVGVI